MFVIVTRNFPPSVGGMQSLMGDLALNFSKYGPVKVFADAMKNRIVLIKNKLIL
jgi:hypothetical protein